MLLWQQLGESSAALAANQIVHACMILCANENHTTQIEAETSAPSEATEPC